MTAADRRSVLLMPVVSAILLTCMQDCNAMTTESQNAIMEESAASNAFIFEIQEETSIPQINALDVLADKPTTNTSMAYIQQASNDVCDFMKSGRVGENLVDSIPSMGALIDYRDRLLAVGGSARASLAGSITYSIHHVLFHDLLFSENANTAAIESLANKNRIVLKDVLHALSKDERWREETNSLNLEANDVSLLKEFLVGRGLDPDRQGDRAWWDCLRNRGLTMRLAFDRSLLKEEDLASHLFLWALLIDDQECLSVILEYQEQASGDLEEAFKSIKLTESMALEEAARIVYDQQRKIVQEIDAFIDKGVAKDSPRTFKPINGDDVWRCIKGKAIIYSERDAVLDFYLDCHLKGYGKRAENGE